MLVFPEIFIYSVCNNTVIECILCLKEFWYATVYLFTLQAKWLVYFDWIRVYTGELL
jgi:hypothetical protein